MRLSTTVVLLVLVGPVAIAHEGHEPLPTKGVSVQGDAIYLSLEARRALQLTVQEVDLGDLNRTLTATASIVVPWQQHAYVTTRVGGRISQIYHRAGDQVQAETIIAEVESLELVNEQLELIQYALESELAQQTLDRLGRLGDSGVVAGMDISAAAAMKLEKSISLDVSKRKLRGLGFSDQMLQAVLRTKQPKRSLPIIAPVAGMIVHADVSPGQVVQPTEHLFEILDLAKVYAEAAIVESEIHRIEVGQSARVSLTGIPGVSFEGVIDLVGLPTNAATRSLPIWISLTNADAENPMLRPGMFGSVEIVIDRADKAVVCPDAALITSGAETIVFVEQAPGEYLRKSVVLGMRTPQFAEVLDGIYPGDRVVLHGSRQFATLFEHGVLTVTPQAGRNIGLELAVAEPRGVEQVVTINGTVEVRPDRRSFVSSQILGKVSKILVEVTAAVEQDQPIAEIESLEFQDLQLDLLRTQSRMRAAKMLLEAGGSSGGVIAMQQVLERETNYRKLENELRGLEEKLRLLGLDPGDVQHILQAGEILPALPLRAPSAGFVVTLNVIPGQVVNSGDRILEIHDLSEMWVRGYLFERDIQQVTLGQSARIRVVSDPRYLATATLLRTNAVLAGSDRVLSVWASVDNSDLRLRDNMLARLTVSTGTVSTVLTLPLAAVLQDGHRAYVFIQRADAPERFDRRAVQTGARDDRFVEIKSGLSARDVVAISGVHALQTAYATIK